MTKGFYQNHVLIFVYAMFFKVSNFDLPESDKILVALTSRRKNPLLVES